MNYIQKLNAEIKALNAQRLAAAEKVAELKEYLNSSKFNCGNELDGYVNVKDVLARLRQIDLADNL